LCNKKKINWRIPKDVFQAAWCNINDIRARKSFAGVCFRGKGNFMVEKYFTLRKLKKILFKEFAK